MKLSKILGLSLLLSFPLNFAFDYIRWSHKYLSPFSQIYYYMNEKSNKRHFSMFKESFYKLKTSYTINKSEIDKIDAGGYPNTISNIVTTAEKLLQKWEQKIGE